MAEPAISPEAYAHAAAEKEYEATRSREGLSDDDLGFGVILNNTNSVLIGFFTSFVYTQIAGSTRSTKSLQMVLITLSVTTLSMALERFYFHTLGAASWATSRSWSSVWRKFMRFFSMVMVFITTNFALSWYTQNFIHSNANSRWHELIALVYIPMLAFFYLMHAFNVTR